MFFTKQKINKFSCFFISDTSPDMIHICPEVTQGRGEDGVRPITVQEIQEAVRRHAQGYCKTLGMYRSCTDRPKLKPYLAI